MFYRLALRAATAAAVLLLAAPAPARAAAPPPPDEAPRFARHVVTFLGDSLTAGLGLTPEQAYPALLAQRFGHVGIRIVAVNAGVSGDTTAGAVRRLDWVLRRKPEVLVVALGANDGLRGLPVDIMEDNLRRIVFTAKSAGVKVLLAGMRLPPNMGPEYASKFAAVYPKLAQELDVPLVPFLLDGVGGVRELNQADGIHPTAKGQEKVADNVYPYLFKLLGS